MIKMYYDLTYNLNYKTAIYPGDPLYKIERVADIGDTSFCNVSKISMSTHTGTHMDAPLHFVNGAKDVAHIPIEQCCGRAVLYTVKDIDLSSGKLGIECVQNIEVQARDILILRTSNGDRFRGNNILDNFVEITVEAAKYLVKKSIKMIAVDYMTIENAVFGQESAHSVFLRNDVIIVESLNLQGVADGIYEAFCFPLKMDDADGSPVRFILREWT